MRTLFLALALALGSLTAIAQVDVKLNAGSALFGGLGLAADIVLNEQSSVSAGLAYAKTSANITIDGTEDKYSYGRFRILPEYRYYVAPRYGADRFFVGGYGKFSFIEASSTNTEKSYEATRAALGVLVGHKWVFDNGFVLELNAGGGGGAFLTDSRKGSEVTTVLNAISTIDFRLGIIVGYRF